MARRNIRPAGLVVVLIAAIAGGLVIGGSNGMSLFSQPEPLLWQGAADRKPTQFVAIEVSSVKADSGGFLGIGQSPSIAGAYPDARVVKGHRMDAGGKKIEIHAPGAELPAGLAKGANLVLGMVDSRHVIRFLLPPPGLSGKQAEEWAQGQNPE